MTTEETLFEEFKDKCQKLSKLQCITLAFTLLKILITYMHKVSQSGSEGSETFKEIDKVLSKYNLGNMGSI